MATKKDALNLSEDGSLMRRVKVHHANMDERNRDHPIVINVNGDKKIFHPGVEVELTEAQLGGLVNSVEETEIRIDMQSGIYKEKDPLTAARGQLPGFDFTRDKATGEIIASRMRPNYIITSADGLPI